MAENLHFTDDPLDVHAFRRDLDSPRAGAVLVFEGTVRDHSPAGEGIIALEYEVKRPMADRIVAAILADVRARYPVEAASVLHRVGRVSLMEPTVLVGVASAHRSEAFAACRELIDRVKHEAPIWKRELFPDGKGRWSEGCTACSHPSHTETAPPADASAGNRLAMNAIAPLLDKAVGGERLSPEEALTLLRSPDWTRIAAAGKARRDAIHDPGRVSYTGFRVINYTNYCDVDCTFCSFKDEVGSQRGYTLSQDEISRKTEEALAQGVDQIFIQGGVNPELPLDWYLETLEMLTRRHRVRVRGFSPIELKRLADKEGLPLPRLLGLLKDAGLGSVPGAGAEILTERMRRILSPKKLSGEGFCAVMGACHEAGLPGSVNIVFGSEESDEDIVEHFRLLRDQQDRTGGFLSFIPWVFQPQTKRFKVRHVKGWEYLRLLAVSRLFFDNIPHIEVSILVMGKELAELGLMAGADDINSIVIEENVLRSSGLKTLRAAERYITEAGFRPERRTLNYEFGCYASAADALPAGISG